MIDIFEAYKSWPVDVRAKLSMHDLRRMGGYEPADCARCAELKLALTNLIGSDDPEQLKGMAQVIVASPIDPADKVGMLGAIQTLLK